MIRFPPLAIAVTVATILCTAVPLPAAAHRDKEPLPLNLAPPRVERNPALTWERQPVTDDRARRTLLAGEDRQRAGQAGEPRWDVFVAPTHKRFKYETPEPSRGNRPDSFGFKLTLPVPDEDRNGF